MCIEESTIISQMNYKMFMEMCSPLINRRQFRSRILTMIKFHKIHRASIRTDLSNKLIEAFHLTETFNQTKDRLNKIMVIAQFKIIIKVRIHLHLQNSKDRFLKINTIIIYMKLKINNKISMII